LEDESQRQQHASSEAEDRLLFLKDLQSEVSTLRNRFQLSKNEMTEDLAQMARELHEASDAFRSRVPGNQFQSRKLQKSRARSHQDVVEAGQKEETPKTPPAKKTRRRSSSGSKAK
jgi:hypothetical protein